MPVKLHIKQVSAAPIDWLKFNRNEILALTRKHGAYNVRVFGSFARGKIKSNSDLDLLVDFASNRSLIDHVALIQALEDLLGRKVDVVTEKALHWYIRERVLSEAIPL